MGAAGAVRGQVAQPAQEILGPSDWVSITERGDGVALLSGQMVKMGLPAVLDRPIPRPWTQRGRSGGGTAVLGRASRLTEGAHRTGSVATSLQGRHHTLRRLTAPVIAPWDFRDARLRHLLTPWSKKA